LGGSAGLQEAEHGIYAVMVVVGALDLVAEAGLSEWWNKNYSLSIRMKFR
jgi:hypothetical protein